MEPVIEVTLHKEEKEARTSALGPIHNDTLCTVDKGVSSHWGEIYKMFQHESYLELPKGDPNLGVYHMIKVSILHKIVSHVAIFPCVEVVSWIIHEEDVDKRIIRDKQIKSIFSFKSLVLHMLQAPH